MTTRNRNRNVHCQATGREAVVPRAAGPARGVKKPAACRLVTAGIASLVMLAATVMAAPVPPAASPFAPTIPNTAPAPTNAPPGMVWIPGGEFSMGCTVPNNGICSAATMNAVNDSQPVHRVYVDGFWMDKTDVTNDEFDKFVKATGYKTVAEIAPTKEEFPTAPPENLVAGSTVFTPTTNAVPLDDYFQWWRYVPGADWRHPTGPDSNLQAGGIIPSCRSPTPMRRLTRSGPANVCRRRRNGNLPRAAA